ncbi:MAG: hypothetical protein AAFS13_00485, partial [Pseudomonadota bacterium]
MRHLLLAGLAGFALTACGTSETTTVETAAAPAAEPSTAVEEPTVAPLDAALAGAWRSEENKARDVYRNPKRTLTFFDVDADETVIEIYPGGGWYTEVIAPYLNTGGGTYIAANFGNEERDQQFLERFSDSNVFGEVNLTTLNPDSGPLIEDNSVDTVLSFRNVHNWMGAGFEKKVLEDVYASLKPGGIFGLVEHRLPSSADQDPQARSGYVHEDYMISLAKEVGFEFDGSSEVNANPNDTADHPFGVWTLPPVSRTTDRDGNAPEGFDPQKYIAIALANLY